MASSNHITNEIIITAMDRFVWFILLVVMSHLVTEFTRVTGYTRGNARSDEQNALNYRPPPPGSVLNDSLAGQGRQVQSLVFFPATVHDYAYYAPPPPAQIAPLPPQPQPMQSAYQQQPAYLQQQQPAYQQQALPQQAAANAPLLLPGAQTGAATTAAATSGFSFSLRPLIDSIFDIPISTLRAVNNLVARLTGSYQHQQAPLPPHQYPGGRSAGGSEVSGLVSPKSDAVNFRSADIVEEDAVLLAHAMTAAGQPPSGGGGSTAKKTLLREVSA